MRFGLLTMSELQRSEVHEDERKAAVAAARADAETSSTKVG
jgi:hypothetical protein